MGDGGGDFCPCSLLVGEHDLCCARRDPNKEYGLTRRISADRAKADASKRHFSEKVTVKEWSTGTEMRDIVSAWLDRWDRARTNL